MSAIEVTITGSREWVGERLDGSVTWRISEFDNDRYMLIAQAAGTQFHAHFTGEQWAEFQKLIAGLS